MTTGPDRHEAEEQTEQAARPQAPVLVIGRWEGFLDVQPTVHEAEVHLTHEHLAGAHALSLDGCDYYDGIARPLQPVMGHHGAVTLEPTPGGPQPDLLRQRVNDFLRWALETCDLAAMPEESRVDKDELEPLPDGYSFARFLDELDERFNRPVTRHVAGRLHNFWHAVGG